MIEVIESCDANPSFSESLLPACDTLGKDLFVAEDGDWDPSHPTDTVPGRSENPDVRMSERPKRADNRLFRIGMESPET